MGVVDVIFGWTVNAVMGIILELSCGLNIILLERFVAHGSYVAVV